MPQLVEIHFKGNRKSYFEWHEPEPLRHAEPVIVESERGLDFGVVSATGAAAQQKCDRCQSCAVGGEREGDHAKREPEPVRKVVRRASQADRRTMEELRRQEDDVRRKVRDKARSHKLTMKISDAEWQWDRNRLTVYFTADKRVDFRALVRDLAAMFRTRIELRQIGVRDEAARLGGIGRCGRELCSASWLPELRPIGLQIAKDQRLSLNPSQISGPCGRLLCCLRYEHEFYVQTRKRFPKEGKVVRTLKGFEKVYSIDIFRERVTLRAEDGAARTLPLAEFKEEIELAAKQGDLPPPADPRPEPHVERREKPRPEGRARPNARAEARPAAPVPEPTPEDSTASETRGPQGPSGPASAEPGLQAGRRRRGRRGGRRRRNRKGGDGGTTPSPGGGPSGAPS